MATKKTKVNTTTEKETKAVAIDEISENSNAIEGVCLAEMTGIKTGKDDMPLLTISLTDRRTEGVRGMKEITICPFRAYSFGIGGEDGGATYAESTVVGFGNVISAAESYSRPFALYEDVTLSSNTTWGSASAAKAFLRGILCEAMMYYLSNTYGKNTILKPNFSIINKYIDAVYDWMDKYRKDYAEKPGVKIMVLEDEINALNDKITELSSKNEELEKELLSYKASLAFSKVTIDELNEERKDSISKKELKRRLAKAAESLKRK